MPVLARKESREPHSPGDRTEEEVKDCVSGLRDLSPSIPVDPKIRLPENRLPVNRLEGFRTWPPSIPVVAHPRLGVP